MAIIHKPLSALELNSKYCKATNSGHQFKKEGCCWYRVSTIYCGEKYTVAECFNEADANFIEYIYNNMPYFIERLLNLEAIEAAQNEANDD